MNRLLDIVLIVVALCAVTITALLVRREFFTPSVTSGTRAVPQLAPDQIARLGAVGTAQGASTGKVVVVEFTDLQCPYCALFNDSVNALLDRHREVVHLVTIETPLRAIHPIANPAAIAALCAERQGKFRAFTTATYRAQARLSVAALDSLGREAGIADAAAFTACRSDPSVAARVDSSLALANRLQIEATPTFYIDGRLVPLGTTPGRFAAMVDAQVATAR